MNSTLARTAGSILICTTLVACGGSATPVTTAALPAATPTIAATPVASPTPAPTATPTPSLAPSLTPVPPAAPTNVVETDLVPPAKCPTAYGASCFAYKVTWSEADPAGVTVKLYAVTKCLAKPHCLTAATAIPSADLALLGTAPASKGVISFVVGDGETYGDGWLPGSKGTTLYVYATVIQASTVSGVSSFVIAWTW
jgi:hypothetical protein